MDSLSVFYNFIGENKIDINEVMRLNNERVAKEEKEKRAAAARDEEQRVATAKRREQTIRLEKERVAMLEKERTEAIANERQKWLAESGGVVADFFTELQNSGSLPPLSPLPDDDETPHVFTQEVVEEKELVVDPIGACSSNADTGDVLNLGELNFIFPTPTTNEARASTQTAAVRPQGKNIGILRQAYNELDFSRLEEHVDKRNYRRTLCFKKKDLLIDTYAIQNRYDKDVVVTAENKFKELKHIYNEKQKKIKKLVKVKDKLATLELIAARYVLPDKTGKKK